MLRLVILLFACATVTPAIGADKTEDKTGKKPAISVTFRQELETFLTLSGREKRFDQDLDVFIDGQMKTLGERVKPDAKPKWGAATSKVKTMIRGEMGWAKSKEMHVEFYAGIYTEPEIKQINKLLKDPVMQRFLEREHNSQAKISALVIDRMKGLNQKIQETIRDELNAPGPM